jgi:hypothetical protein
MHLKGLERVLAPKNKVQGSMAVQRLDHTLRSFIFLNGQTTCYLLGEITYHHLVQKLGLVFLKKKNLIFNLFSLKNTLKIYSRNSSKSIFNPKIL